MHDDVTAHAISQPLDNLVAARHDFDVNLVRVLVGARLARPDVLHAGAAVLHTDLRLGLSYTSVGTTADDFERPLITSLRVTSVTRHVVLTMCARDE